MCILKISNSKNCLIKDYYHFVTTVIIDHIYLILTITILSSHYHYSCVTIVETDHYVIVGISEIRNEGPYKLKCRAQDCTTFKWLSKNLNLEGWL